MRSSGPTPVWTLDSAHLEEREGERGSPRTPRDPAPPRGRGQGAGSGIEQATVSFWHPFERIMGDDAMILGLERATMLVRV